MEILLAIVLFGLTQNFVDGRGCYKDPKVYIVKVTIEQQWLHLQSARVKCEQQKLRKQAPADGVYCNTTFDGITCWPHTKAGVTAKQLCPNYINNFYTKAYATRQCMEDGTWYVHPNLSKEWSDFSSCMTKPDLSHLNNNDDILRIQLMYRIGYGISLTSLVVALFLMLWFKKLRCHRNIIHVNLFISFALRAVVIFIKDAYVLPDGLLSTQNETATFDLSSSNWQCKLVSVIFHYLLVANYMWIFNEGLYLHTLILFSTFKPAKIFYFCIIFGWSSPLLCIIPWVIIRRYLENTMCWNTHNKELKFDWILRGPIVCTICINFLFFFNIIRVLFTKLTALQANSPHRYRRLARSTLVLITLFGLYYMISVAMPDCMERQMELVWLYVESGINSIQGFLVALLFCFLNGEVRNVVLKQYTKTIENIHTVRAELRKRWNRHMLRRLSTVSSRTTRTMSLGSSVFVKDKMSPSIMYADSVMKDESHLKPLNGYMEMRKDSDSSTCNNNENSKNKTVTIVCDHDKDEQTPIMSSSEL